MERKRVHLRGIVQGIGFRPHVWRLASQWPLTGWVQNDGLGVVLELQGDSQVVARFLGQLQHDPPAGARIEEFLVHDVAVQTSEQGFTILASSLAAPPRAAVPPDLGMCPDCQREIHDPTNRRFGYPFTNCTHCGPRFTILEALPYDRERTTMRIFPMCSACQAEYENPADRRFHAEPNACPTCGPILWRLNSDVADLARFQRPDWPAGVPGPDALADARDMIRAGGLLAIKGVGGFHIACDATQPMALERLRDRKNRVAKPLALLVRDVATCTRFVHVSAAEQFLLESPARPIVLLRRKADATRLPDAIAPGNDHLGFMLPNSPLQELLIPSGEVWVMTSGNLSEEPIAYDNVDAARRLAPLVDGFLLHDRPIQVPCDDSVMRATAQGPLPIRRARGYAPLPIRFTHTGPHVLAVGAERKNSLCVVSEDAAYLSQHVGDLENQETLRAFERICEHLLRLYEVQPQLLVADLHPDYLASRWAAEKSRDWGIPLHRVQHHHAHLGSLMAEHQMHREDRILGCCFDGAGYGPDMAIWGGEWMLASSREFVRLGHLDYLPLPGGDASVRYPARAALAYLNASDVDWDDQLPCVGAVSRCDQRNLRVQLERGFRSPPTSSAGRLFDAVASICGLRHTVSFEGQAAMELETCARRFFSSNDASPPSYPVRWIESTPWRLDCVAIVREVAGDALHQRPPEVIAGRFHGTMADAIVGGCERARAQVGIDVVGLSGGVFQNGLLVDRVHAELTSRQFRVLTHHVVPPNDGGLALGQAFIGREHLPASPP